MNTGEGWVLFPRLVKIISICQKLTRGKKINDSRKSPGNCLEFDTQIMYHQDKNIASYNRLRLEGKIVCQVVMTCQEETYLGLTFPCYQRV